MEIEANSESGKNPPGPQLRQAREAADLSLDQAAEHLKITVSYIRALEEDDHEILPDRPYVMGYLRAYSRLLSIDTDTLLDDYQQHFSGSDAGGEAKAGARDGGASGKKITLRAWILIIVAVLLVWAGAVTLLEDRSEPDSVSVVETETSQVGGVTDAVRDEASTSDAVELQSGADSTLPVTETEPLTVAEGALAEAVESLPQSISESTSEESGIATTDEENIMDTLAFVFSGECWLEVTDANGDVLAADLHQAGDEFLAQGKAPFDVMLGDVRLVSVSFNGKPYKLKPNGFRKTLRAVVQ